MPVITIGRQYGAGGETIGAMVAERLGADLVDRKIFEEVGAFFNVTRERIRQIEAKALRKLRHPTRSRRLKAYTELL